MRTSEIKRKTAETDIELFLDLDGNGSSKINTGCPFLDHMLTLFARHGDFTLNVNCKGDTQVDYHHTAEDIAICLGDAFKEALGDMKGITRYGSFILPMDESLVLCAIDLCGRPYLQFECDFTAAKVGDMETELAREFFYAVSYSAGINLHIKMLTPGNNHHMMEAMFKAFGKALDMATGLDERVTDVLSTKGSL